MTESEFKSYAAAARTLAPEERSSVEKKNKRPEGKKGKSRAAGPTTDHVLFNYPADKKEDFKSLE